MLRCRVAAQARPWLVQAELGVGPQLLRQQPPPQSSMESGPLVLAVNRGGVALQLAVRVLCCTFALLLVSEQIPS